MNNLEQLARDAVTAWQKWCEAEGWDNNEYDDVAAAMNDLELFLGMRKEDPEP